MVKALLYVRVSTKEQEEGYSQDAQQKLGIEYAGRNNLEIVKTWKVSESAWKADRKYFEEMLTYAKKNNIKNIIFDVVDRMTRNPFDLVKIEKLVKEHDVTIHFSRLNQQYSKNATPDAELMLGLNALMARKYSSDISMKVKMGTTEKVKQGGFPHKAPVGYLNDTKNNTLIIDPERAPLIKKAFEMALSGSYSLGMIKDTLNSMGFSTHRGNKLHKSRLQDILKNPIYYGDMRWHGQIMPGKHEPIISRAMFDRVQEATQKRPHVTTRTNNFPFNSLITCGDCDCRVIGGLYKNKKYRLYHCTFSKGRHPGFKYIREADLPGMFEKTLDKSIPNDEVIDYIVKTVLTDSGASQEYSEKRLSGLLSRRKSLEGRLSQVYEEKLDNKIPEDFWKTKDEDYRRQISAIDSELVEIKASEGKIDERGLTTFELIKGLKDKYKKGNYAKKAEIIKIVASNHVLSNNSLTPQLKKPFVYLNEGLSTIWRE